MPFQLLAEKGAVSFDDKRHQIGHHFLCPVFRFVGG
jgi:hypothetical protein